MTAHTFKQMVMDDRLLCKCRSSIAADQVTEVLDANGIASRRHDEADRAKPFCPRCGSEDLVRIERSRYATPMLILSIFLFIAPCAYLYLTTGAENKSIIMDSLAIAVFIASIILMILGGRKNANLRCKHCGKKFNHVS